jgi:hypothetical protein
LMLLLMLIFILFFFIFYKNQNFIKLESAAHTHRTI